MRPTPVRRLLVRVLVPISVLATAACGGASPSADNAGDSSDDRVVVYSGRSEALVKPLFEKFEKATGVDLEVRYGGSAELAAQLVEEGDKTNADVFFSQDAGALGALSKTGRLAELPTATTDKVAARFRADDRRWVGVSGRARVVAYDSAAVKATEVPKTVAQLIDPKWQGKVAYAPTNASFQAFVTAMRVLLGEAATRAWLQAFKDNGAKAYDNNVEILRAVEGGRIALGLINHYYWYELAHEKGEKVLNAKIGWLDQGDPGALVNVAGVGVLTGTKQAEGAAKLVDYLLAAEAQQFFAEKTSEYPLIDGVPAAADLPPLAQVSGPDIDLSKLDSLQETLAMLEEVSVL